MTDLDDTDMLAAEYVLGTLDSDERAGVARRLHDDAGLMRAVDEWHARLAPLTDAISEVMPPDAVYDGIVTRLFGSERGWVPGMAPDAGQSAIIPLRRLRRWQGAAGGFALLAASLLVWIAARETPVSPDQPRFTAVLQKDAGSPVMVMEVDVKAQRLTVRPIGAPSPDGHVYQLWIVDPSIGAPRSLGLVPPRSETEASLRGIAPAVVTDATYAVTIEPPGGSPTGLPTTTPILSGKLVASSP